MSRIHHITKDRCEEKWPTNLVVVDNHIDLNLSNDAAMCLPKRLRFISEVNNLSLKTTSSSVCKEKETVVNNILE